MVRFKTQGFRHFWPLPRNPICQSEETRGWHAPFGGFLLERARGDVVAEGFDAMTSEDDVLEEGVAPVTFELCVSTDYVPR